MTQPKLTLEERLTKYKISRERYDNETARLLAVGFTLQQADKIILRRSSKNKVEGVLKFYSRLLSAPYQFTFEQITAMASNVGGAQAINAVIKHCPELSSHGYSLEVITALAARIGGAAKIKKTNEREFINFVNEYLIYQPTAEIPQNPVHTTYENNAHEPPMMDFALEFKSDFILDQQATYRSQSTEKSDDVAEDLLLFEDDFEASEVLLSNRQALKQQGLFARSSRRKRSLENEEENTSGKTVRKRTKMY
jgi:hypothetical protein